jgi:metallo-beta-lactamase family protein
MSIKLKFLGAAQNVTGSRHLLEANGTKILVDCGLYQERQFRARNWEPFTCPPESLDAVLLTHAHLDHCGLLPKLVKEGFKGRIYCTAATAEIAQIILLDSAHLQEEDARYKRKRHKRQKRKGPYPVEPLYTTTDAEACFPQFSSVKYKQPIEIGAGVEATFCDAGHVLGSSIIRVKVSRNGQDRIVIFSGDIGRPDRPIVQDPSIVEQADYVLVESTYGDRVHEGPEDTKKLIAEVINSTKQAGGNIIVPSFALERSQELLYYINELLVEKAIPQLPVFLDTKAINHIRGTVMVIAGSGMCTGGRVKHHLVNNITRPENTIMFVGYQAVGTLGRRIVNGEKEVRILGQEYPVNARIARINGFSAHADKEELFEWLNELKKPPRKVFVVHGESDSANEFGDYIREKTGWQVVVPAYQDEAVLD